MREGMKIAVKRLIRDEKGQALVLVLILLLVGGLIIAPLLAYMGTGLIAGKVYERRTAELYAADAGVEDALYKILSHNVTLQSLDVNHPHTYTLANSINGISPVNITVTKLSLLEGLVDESEYKLDPSHQDWFSFDTPYDTHPTEEYVEYHCTISFNYTGEGNRQLQKVGAFFSPSTTAEIKGPCEIIYTGVMTEENLKGITTETVAGGFQFVWEWKKNQGPVFQGPSCGTGGLHFKFKVYDPEWAHELYFVWALVKEQDISFITNAPDSYKWLIEATAGNTEVRSAVVELSGEVGILTWEIN